MKQFIKYLLYLFVGILSTGLLIGIITIKPIPSVPLDQSSIFNETKQYLNNLAIPSFAPDSNLQVGWAENNITPASGSLVGYTPRDSFTTVLDSLYTRVITISNGNVAVSLISLDLIIVPPLVRDKVEALLLEKEIPVMPYFAAVHTHNAFGNWDNSLAGSFIVGDFRPQLVDQLSNQIVAAIEKSYRSMLKASIYFYKIDVSELVKNRLNNQAKIDPFLRGLKIERADGSSGYLSTYAAHPTNLLKTSTFLSAEYPGKLVEYLKKEGNADFAMFIAGMVGSHKLAGIEAVNQEKIDIAGRKLGQQFLNAVPKFQIDSIVHIEYRKIILPNRKAQLRIGGKWQLRNWLFETAFGPLTTSVTVFKIDELVMIAMPGDFSGELYQNSIAANHPDLEVMITSFNGDFAGYIIDDRRYWNTKNEEANAMNWLGPYGGAYFAYVTNKLLEKLDN